MQELFTGYICCLDIEHTQIQILNKNTFDEEKFTLSIPNEDSTLLRILSILL